MGTEVIIHLLGGVLGLLCPAERGQGHPPCRLRAQVDEPGEGVAVVPPRQAHQSGFIHAHSP